MPRHPVPARLPLAFTTARRWVQLDLAAGAAVKWAAVECRPDELVAEAVPVPMMVRVTATTARGRPGWACAGCLVKPGGSR